MYSVPAGEFKAKCLHLMEEVKKHNASFVVTKRGIPIAKLVPIEIEQDPFGALEGTILYKEDLSQVTVGEAWEADAP